MISEFRFACRSSISSHQRFPVPFFSVPIPVLRLPSLGTRFRFRFRVCACLVHDSGSGSETQPIQNSILIPVPRLNISSTQFRFRFRDETQPGSLGVSIPIQYILILKGIIGGKRGSFLSKKGFVIE